MQRIEQSPDLIKVQKPPGLELRKRKKIGKSKHFFKTWQSSLWAGAQTGGGGFDGRMCIHLYGPLLGAHINVCGRIRPSDSKGFPSHD